jgi:hypothetical protein
VTDLFVGVAKVAPGVEEVDGDDVVDGVVGVIEVILLLL